MFKRVSSVVMVIAMLLTMLCTFSVASAATPMSLGITARNNVVEYERGQNVILTVAMKDYTGACLLGIKGEYDAAVLTNPTAIPADFGATASFNKANLYTGWVFADNNVVYDQDFNEASTFNLITYRFTIAADAPLGETVVKIRFAEKDMNDNNSNAYNSANGVVVMVPGTDYVTDAAAITLKIVCDHDIEGVELAQPAAGTAQADAKHGYPCTKCGELVNGEACDFDDISEPDTCTRPGKTGVVCSVCEYEISEVKDEITDHDWQPDGFNAKENGTHVCANNAQESEPCDFVSAGSTGGTCTVDLVEYFECTVCEYQYDKTTVAPGHVLESNGDGTHSCANCDEADATCNYTKDAGSSGATCQIAGSVTKECACGDQKTIEGAKKEHVYGEYTDNGDGTHSATCTTCDPAVATPAVDTEDCDYSPLTEADCDNAGTKKCGTCGAVAEDQPATGHAWGDWTHVDGTETHSRECANTNCPIGTETADCADANPDEFGPTCEDYGYTLIICDDCGEEYEVIDESEQGEPIGHVFDAYTHSVTPEGDHVHSSVGVCANGCGSAVVDEPCEITGEPATCVEPGYEECEICDYYKDLEPAGDEHEEEVILYKEVTEEEDGYIQLYCLACETELSEKEITAYEDIFTDIGENDWFYNEALFNQAFGIMKGTWGEFNGNENITRGQLVTILGRTMFGTEIEDLSAAEFEEEWGFLVEDVVLTDATDFDVYYTGYARLLAGLEIVKGYEDQTFRGEQLVTREEMAAFFVRYLAFFGMEDAEFGEPIEFADANKVSPWFADVLETIEANGLFNGEYGNFNPQNNATRAQAAALMERVLRAMLPIVDVE